MQKVKITGIFKDPADNPLVGKIRIEPLPEFVASPAKDTTYSGPIQVALQDDGSFSASLIATTGWSYKISFDLQTQAGLPVDMRPRYVEIPENAALPDLINISIDDGATRPVFVYDSYLPGEVRATGATPDPDDTGAILVPAALIGASA